MIPKYSVEIDWFHRLFGGMTTDIVCYVFEGIYAISRTIADWTTNTRTATTHSFKCVANVRTNRREKHKTVAKKNANR